MKTISLILLTLAASAIVVTGCGEEDRYKEERKPEPSINRTQAPPPQTSTPAPAVAPTNTPALAPTVAPAATPVIALTATPTATSAPAASAPTPPHVFTGTATRNGAAVPNGTPVTAWIDNVQVPGASVLVIDDRYTLLLGQPGGVAYAGKTVRFKVGNSDATQSQPWEQGGATVLNLTATGTN